MSLYEKIISSYSKSFFVTLLQVESLQKGTSLTDNAKLAKLFQTGEELFRLRSLFTTSPKLKEYIFNPTFAEDKKYSLLLNLFPDLSSPTKSFLKFLTEKKHLFLLPEIAITFQSFLSQLEKIAKVKMVVASPLEKNLGKRLLLTLKEITNSSEIILEMSYNPRLLGGFQIEYNSFSIDASLVKEFRSFLS